MSQSPDRILDTGFITLHTPWSVGGTFLLLEVTVVACGVLAFLHALGRHRRGDPAPLFAWAVSFTYGIVMEVLSYNFVKSFTHGQFTVMFYRHQLPLYVVTLYPVLQYTSMMAARRLRLGIVAEAFTAGLFIVGMDLPFDILGPVHGWWSWSDTDPNIAYRWHGVPVTSYYWHLAFGGILAGLTHVLARFARTPARMAMLALPVSFLVIVAGVISFVPFHFLKARGVADGSIVAGLFVLSAAVGLVALRRAREAKRLVTEDGRDARLLTIPAIYFGAHALVAIASVATVAGFGGKMAVIAAVTAAALAAHALVYRAGVAAEAAIEGAG